MILGMLIGAGLLLLGVVTGHAQGYLMGVKVRNVTALMQPEPETRRCTCGHDITGHVMKRLNRTEVRGKCQTGIGADRHGCACDGYVPKPEPVPTPRRGLLDL